VVEHQNAIVGHAAELEHGLNLYRFCIESRAAGPYPSGSVGNLWSVHP